MTQTISDKVTVKILKHCMQWKPGDDALVSQAEAEAMCQVRKRHNGTTVEDYRVAMPLDEFERIRNAPVELGGLTLDEARALGIKNVTQSPPLPEFSPFGPHFGESKDPAELESAKLSAEINHHNQKKKKASS